MKSKVLFFQSLNYKFAAEFHIGFRTNGDFVLHATTGFVTFTIV